MPKRSSMPRDLNRLARSIVDDAIADKGTEPDSAPEASEIRSYAQELGRRGGLKGGKARAAKLTAEERRESARRAAAARWAKHQPRKGD